MTAVRQGEVSFEGSSDEEESEYERSLCHGDLKGRVISGEAPESDVEQEEEAVTGQSVPPVEPLTIHLSPKNKEHPPGSLLKSLDPFKHRTLVERNRSLFKGLSQSFLEETVVESTRRLDKLSHNLSNTQMQMQECLLQCRIGTGNLLRLQTELSHSSGATAQFQRLNVPPTT